MENKENAALAGLIAYLTEACACVTNNDPSCDISFILAVIKAASYQIGAYSGILMLTTALQYGQAQGMVEDIINEEKQTVLDLQALLSQHNF